MTDLRPTDDDRPARLADYVRSHDLALMPRGPAWDGHVGGCLSDAVLQAHRNYEQSVEPRVQRFCHEHPGASTVGGFLDLCGPRPEAATRWCELIGYRSLSRGTRVIDLAELLSSHGVETADEARSWLANPSSPAALLRIHGVGPKTAAYLGGLFGVAQAVAVDVRLQMVLRAAGVTWTGWNDARQIIVGTADILGVDPWILDGALWTHAASFAARSDTSS